MKGQIKIAKTVKVENPLTYTQWCKKYKVGSRIERVQQDVDMYKRGEYDFNKLAEMIIGKKPSLYERILFYFKAA